MKYIKKKFLYSIFILSVMLFFIFGLLKINNYIFFMASVSINIFLLLLIKQIIKKFKIKFNKKEIIILIIVTLSAYLFYIISIMTRKFIYYWDYSCYYNIQLKMIDCFKNGIEPGLRALIYSTWEGEYGTFLNFIPQIIFEFTNKSINSYIISCVIIFIPYIVITYSILIKRVMLLIKINNTKSLYFYLISLLSLILMPLFHGSFIFGQPDIFGLFFIFIIIILTIDYNFQKIEVDKLSMIFLSTYMLTICRRWYIYWIISYYMLYVIYILLTNKKYIKRIVKNLLLFGIIVVIIYLVTLLPFINNTIINNYSSSYSYYSNGGFLYELGNQVKHLGYILFFVIIGGLLYGIINKQYRNITLLNIIHYLIIIFLFSRIQTMGIHHSLLLLPNYLFGIILFIVCIIGNKKNISIFLTIMIIVIFILNMYNGYKGGKSKLFTDISIRPPEELNYKGIKEVTDWLQENIDKDNTAYMIVHNNTFNPDKFRNFYTPNSKVHEYLPYGSSIIGVHKFPTELFTAKYVITTDPYVPTSVDEKYNKVFNELVMQEKFELKKEFIMQDKTKVLVYERVKEVDEEEKGNYIDALKEESKKYENLYKKIIQNFELDT